MRGGVTALLEAALSVPEAAYLGAFAQLLQDGLAPAGRGDGASETVHAAIVFGVGRVVQDRLQDGRPERLRDLLDPIVRWVLEYEGAEASVPSAWSGTRRPERGASDAAPQPMLDLFGAAGERERIMRAAVELSAERGYAAVTTRAIIERAKVSSETFHEHFKSRQDAAIAAYDLASLRALGATLASFQAAADWPAAIHGSLWTLLGLIAAAPELARLAFVEIGVAGATGRERTQERLHGFGALLYPGFERLRDPPPRVVAKMIAGGVWGVIEKRIAHGQTDELTAHTPQLSYFALTPFVGAVEAARVAESPPRP